MSPAEEDAVVIAFLQRYSEDRAAGRLLEPSEYSSAYPGYEAAIDRELAALAGTAEFLPAEIGRYELCGKVGRGARRPRGR